MRIIRNKILNFFNSNQIALFTITQMICSLESLKQALSQSKIKGNSVRILESSEPDMQMMLSRWGILSSNVSIKLGPWGSFIIKSNCQEIALGPSCAKSIKVETTVF